MALLLLFVLSWKIQKVKKKVENSFKRPNLAPDTQAYAFVRRYIYDKILFLEFYMQTTYFRMSLYAIVPLLCDR